MAGKKGRSGRRPQSARHAFNLFAEGYEEDQGRRYMLWLNAQHQAAMNGDGQAGRFLLEQYMGRAQQSIDVTEEKSDAWYALQREIHGAVKEQE